MTTIMYEILTLISSFIQLERSESTQQQLDSTLENAVNANEVKHQEPVGAVPLSFASVLMV